MQSSTPKSHKNSTFQSYRAQRLKTPGHSSPSNLSALKDLQQLEQIARSRFYAQTARNSTQQQSQSLTERKQYNVMSEYGDFGLRFGEGKQSDMEKFKANLRLPLDQIQGSNSQRQSLNKQEQSKPATKSSNFKGKVISGNCKPDAQKKSAEGNGIINRLIKTKSTNIKHKDSRIDKTNDKLQSLCRNRLSKYLMQIQKLQSQLVPSNLLSDPVIVDSLFKQLTEIITHQMLK